MSGLTEAKATRTLQAAIHAVTFRYMEYCITAPLLFLAVVTLLTVDAPAWYPLPAPGKGERDND